MLNHHRLNKTRIKKYKRSVEVNNFITSCRRENPRAPLYGVFYTHDGYSQMIIEELRVISLRLEQILAELKF